MEIFGAILGEHAGHMMGIEASGLQKGKLWSALSQSIVPDFRRNVFALEIFGAILGEHDGQMMWIEAKELLKRKIMVNTEQIMI